MHARLTVKKDSTINFFMIEPGKVKVIKLSNSAKSCQKNDNCNHRR